MTSLAPLPVPTASPVRPPSGAAVAVAVVLTALASTGLALVGLLVLGMSAMCYDAGTSPQANTCAGVALACSAYAFATLLVPVVIGVARSRDRAVFYPRLVCALSAYVPALVAVGYLLSA